MKPHALVFAAVLLPVTAFAQSAMTPAKMPPMVTAADIQAVIAKAKAMPPKPLILLNIAGGGSYAANLEYRPIPGAAAFIHDNFHETITVIEGSGTFTVGGTLINPKPSDNGPSGTAITGGTVTHVAKGDVVFVPAGTAHASVPDAGAPPALFVVRTPGPAAKP